MGVKLGFPP